MKKNVLTIIDQYSGILFTGWLLISFTATHMPLPESTDGLPYVDKISHVIIYLLLSILLSLWWNKQKQLTHKQYFNLFVILFTYSLLDEYLQAFVGRTPDFKDIAADVIGILLGFIIVAKWKK